MSVFGLIRLLLRQQDPSSDQTSVDVARRHQAEMSDFGKALGQDVLKEAGDEGLGCHGGGGTATCADGHAVAVVIEDAVVGDGDTMGVPAQIVEELLGAGKGPLGVDHPVFGEEFGEQFWEGLVGSEMGWQVQLSMPVSMLEGMEELTAEEFAEDFDGEKVILWTSNPPFAVETEPSAGDDAVQVGVKAEVAGPRVQDAGNAKEGAQPFGIATQCDQRLRRGEKEQAVNGPSIEFGELAELAGQRENHVEVVGRQDALPSLSQPSRLCQRLALGAMTVATRVIRRLSKTAVCAHVDMPTQSDCATELDGPHRLPLLRLQRMPFSESVSMRPKDLRHLVSRRRESLRRRARLRCHAELPEHLSLLGAQQVERAFDSAHMTRADLSVQLGRLNRLVAQKNLNRPNIRAQLEQVRGKAMPQHMWRDSLAEATGACGASEHVSSGLLIERFVGLTPGKQVRARRSALHIVSSKDGEQASTQHSEAIAATLGLPDMNHHPLAIDVVDLKVTDLGYAKPRTVSGHQKRSVSHRFDCFEEHLDLGAAENLRQLPRNLWTAQPVHNLGSVQGLLVEKPERRYVRPERTGRRIPFLLKVIQKGSHLFGVQLPRRSHVVLRQLFNTTQIMGLRRRGQIAQSKGGLHSLTEIIHSVPPFGSVLLHPQKRERRPSASSQILFVNQSRLRGRRRYCREAASFNQEGFWEADEADCDDDATTNHSRLKLHDHSAMLGATVLPAP
jgi:hypothetical protein